MSDKKLLTCYNRGCGKSFDPEANEKDCRHHPGVPFFHDAYKGWTCCNKKSVDFTEFLNIKGCELSVHSNVKPIEPQKPVQEVTVEETPQTPVVEPIKPSALVRPDFNELLVRMVPTVAPALQQSIDNIVPIIVKGNSTSAGDIKPGTMCKNGGCGSAYESSASNLAVCVYHPGVPVFHEGLKYWSCCTKRTSDFTAFLAQKGCQSGNHKWIKTGEEAESIKCRYDWHQTASTVVLAVYAKMYHYSNSYVKVNPVRLVLSLVFPQQNDAEFNLDLELRGIIDVASTKVQFLGTKIEVTMTKAEPGHWTQFEVQRAIQRTAAVAPVEPTSTEDDGIESDVDLDDIEAIRGVTIGDEPKQKADFD